MKQKTVDTQKAKSVNRREIIKRGAYAVPAVLTLAVKPSFSSAASGTSTPPRRTRRSGR